MLVESILTLAIAVAGFAYMVGAKDFAIGILKKVGIVVVILALLPCVPRWFGRSVSSQGAAFDLAVPSWALALGGLSLLGFVAWKTRAARKKAGEAWRKKHLHPRKRAIPLPPPAEEDEPWT